MPPSLDTSALLKEAQDARKSDPKRAEAFYNQILDANAQSTARTPQAQRDRNLQDQETALVKLGELYRDTKCVRSQSRHLYVDDFC